MPRVAEQPSHENPRVSVDMITYNHEKFIVQAIESVLMQETDFPVELIIGEDCSTDGTRRIVKVYAEKYPNVIRALLPEHNLGMLKNGTEVMRACRGKYVAYCEGDDYWTDPEKLQRQVDLMEAHPELALCHHTVNYVTWEGGRMKVLKTFPPESDRVTRQASDLIGRNFIQTCSLVVRRAYLPARDAGFQSLKLGDWPMCYLAAEHGGIGFLDTVMADYRVHGNNTWYLSKGVGQQFEVACMALYLASVAQPGAKPAWQRFGMDLLTSVLAQQPNTLKAIREAASIWQSGCLSLLEVMSLLAHDLARRPTAEWNRHPRLAAIFKRVLFRHK